MSTSKISWRARRGKPCPVCGGESACSATDDGLHFCLRCHEREDGWAFLGLDKHGTFGLHREAGDDAPRPQPEDAGDGTPPDFDAILAPYPPGRRLSALAGELGLPEDALARLDVRLKFDKGNPSWCHLFPERDELGRVIGLLRRFPDGAKLQWPGGKRGLIYDLATDYSGATVCPEGGSDTAACLALGLTAVGRPSASAGADLLGELLCRVSERHGPDGTIVIVADNDVKAGGRWPGGEGAVKTARLVAERLGREVLVSQPPPAFKDMREWLTGGSLLGRANSSGLIPEDIAQQVLADLLKRAERVSDKETFHIAVGRSETKTDVPSISDRPTDISNVSNSRPPDERLADPGGPALARVMEPAEALAVVTAGAVAKFCSSHRVPMLQARANPGHALALRVPCMKWDCPECGHRVRADWAAHLMRKAGGWARLFLWEGMTHREWETTRRSIQRRKGDFLAVETLDGFTVVATAAQAGAEGDWRRDAVNAVARVLGRAAGVRRPVTTSKGWQRGKRNEEPLYYRRGQAPQGSFAAVVRALRENGLDPEVVCRGKAQRADWVFPDDWPAERVQAFFDDLAARRRKE